MSKVAMRKQENAQYWLIKSLDNLYNVTFFHWSKLNNKKAVKKIQKLNTPEVFQKPRVFHA